MGEVKKQFGQLKSRTDVGEMVREVKHWKEFSKSVKD